MCLVLIIIYLFINIVDVAVFSSGKIPASLYSSYEQQCKKMAADILEGNEVITLFFLTFLVLLLATVSACD